MADDRTELTVDQADAMLVPGDTVHAIRDAGPALIGGDWSRKQVLALIKKHGAELAGPQASAMNHAVVVVDNAGPVWFETTPGRRN